MNARPSEMHGINKCAPHGEYLGKFSGLHKGNEAVASLRMYGEFLVSCRRSIGSRILRPQDTSAPTTSVRIIRQQSLRHFGIKFKPNHLWSCVSSELSWFRTVPTFPRFIEVSCTTFLVPKCLETFRNQDNSDETQLHL